jgi:Zn-dependent M28 family amino/carboxypeptidase
MSQIRLLPLLFLACAAQAAEHFDGTSWWNTVKVLADDKFEGRDTGSAGERQAQAYIVRQLKSLGIEPAGSNGYYQPVKLRTVEIQEADSTLALVRGGHAQPLTLGEQAFFSTRIVPAPRLDAPLVFVGYGLNIPEKSYDDLAGLDLKGKVAVIVNGSPADIPSALSAHYQSRAERWRVLKAAGAIGLISIQNPASMDIPWPRMSLNRNHASMDLIGPEFDETTGAQLAVTFNPAYADMLLDGTGHTFSEIAALAKDRKTLPRFPLLVSVSATTHISTREVESTNVVARLPGRDAKLKTEYVVLSAHIDHIGIGEPINGDRIYNGAMDNGSGSALLLDIARSLRHSIPLKRSVLFVWVTGEEKGLLGSRFFAAHPTVAASSMVADINTDMFLPIVPLKILTVYGLAESDLGDRVTAVADRLGLRVQPDPAPLRNVFIRSDQYNFIRSGVPSVMIDVGYTPGTPEEKILKDWRTERYHAPSDDTDQPVNLATAAGYEELIRALTIDVANDLHRPQWKSDSFFRRYAADAAH